MPRRQLPGGVAWPLKGKRKSRAPGLAGTAVSARRLHSVERLENEPELLLRTRAPDRGLHLDQAPRVSSSHPPPAMNPVSRTKHNPSVL